MVSMLALASCASYRPAPLPSPEEVLGEGMPSSEAMRHPPAHPLLASRPIDLQVPLSDLDAARLALVASPDLAAARAQVGVADAQLFSAGLVADPQLSLSLDRSVGSGFVDATGIGLDFDLASLFTRGPRVAAARSQREQTRLDVAWNEWLALNQVRLLVRRISLLQQQLDVADEATRATGELYRVNQENMQRGDARLDDVSVYQVGFLDAQDRALALKRELDSTWQDLNVALGVPPDARLKLAPLPPLQQDYVLDSAGLARDASHERLDVLALQQGYAAQEQGLREAVRNSLPLPQFGINRARDNGGVVSHGASLGISLPLWNRNRGEISVSRATREQLAAEYVARLKQTRGDIARQVDDLRAIDGQRRALAAQLPALERATNALQRASREGNVTAIAYETVRSALLDKRLAGLALEQAQREAEVALETAAGKLIWETP